MLKALTTVVLMGASTALFAQATPTPDAGKSPRAERRFDCSKAKDPKACEERVAKMKAARDKARQACQGKEGAEARDCMRREMCAQSADPAKCEARVKERAERRDKLREQHQKK